MSGLNAELDFVNKKLVPGYESLTSNEDTLMADAVGQLLSDLFNWG